MTMRPLMSLPRAMASLDLDCAKDSHSTTSRSQMVSRSWFGTWMPTVDLPAMRSIRIDSAAMARQRSSARPVTREYLTPASGRNSKVVTTGPGVDLGPTCPSTPNSAHFSTRVRSFVAQGLFADDVGLFGAVEERGRRKFVAADGLGRDGDGLDIGVWLACRRRWPAGSGGAVVWEANGASFPPKRSLDGAPGPGVGAGVRLGSSRPAGPELGWGTRHFGEG